MSNENESFDEFEAMLPWYASGRLDAATHARVETALTARDDLRALLALSREDREETIAANQSLGAPSGAVWDRISAVVAAEPRRSSLVSRLADWAGLGAERRPGRLAWTGAAAAIVIVLQGGAILSLLPSSSPGGGAGYTTASAPATTSAGTQLLIGFAPDARLDQLGAFLSEHHASIVGGPRSGLYRVRFGDKALSRPETDALIQQLRAAPLVKLALPAAPL